MRGGGVENLDLEVGPGSWKILNNKLRGLECLCHRSISVIQFFLGPWLRDPKCFMNTSFLVRSIPGISLSPSVFLSFPSLQASLQSPYVNGSWIPVVTFSSLQVIDSFTLSPDPTLSHSLQSAFWFGVAYGGG